MNREVFFDPDEVIVSKTDLKGKITYANSTFCDICGYKLKELIGRPHNIIRHDDMPRAVFKLLWDNLATSGEVFAYVKNATKDGGFYWVFAHVTPTFSGSGDVIGYHSSRRCPDRDLISDVIEPLYTQLCAAERSEANRKEGLLKSSDLLQNIIESKRCSYNELIFSLQNSRAS